MGYTPSRFLRRIVGTSPVLPSSKRSVTIWKVTNVDVHCQTDVGGLWYSVLTGKFGEGLKTKCL